MPRSEMVCSKIINIPCSQDYYDFLIIKKIKITFKFPIRNFFIKIVGLKDILIL